MVRGSAVATWAIALAVLGFARSPAVAAQTLLDAPVEDDLPAPYWDPAAAADRLRLRIAENPDGVHLRLAAARELTALGVVDTTHDARLAWLKQAEAEARAAVALDSANANAHYWLAAALGLIADESGGLSKISAARGAHAATMTALALDPLHPGAHHILGRLHAGSLRLSRLNRLIARGLGLGQILSSASWESAEEHLRLAIAGDPDPWIYPLELAKLLIRRDRADEGIALLRELAARTPRHGLDRHYQAEAITLLESSG
jgi:hypothetical protein